MCHFLVHEVQLFNHRDIYQTTLRNILWPEQIYSCWPIVILHVKLAHYYKVRILHRLTLHIPTSTSESSIMSWSASRLATLYRSTTLVLVRCLGLKLGHRMAYLVSTIGTHY